MYEDYNTMHLIFNISKNDGQLAQYKGFMDFYDDYPDTNKYKLNFTLDIPMSN